MPSNPTCENCRHFDDQPFVPGFGACRVNPPQLDLSVLGGVQYVRVVAFLHRHGSISWTLLSEFTRCANRKGHYVRTLNKSPKAHL